MQRVQSPPRVCGWASTQTKRPSSVTSSSSRYVLDVLARSAYVVVLTACSHSLMPSLSNVVDTWKYRMPSRCPSVARFPQKSAWKYPAASSILSPSIHLLDILVHLPHPLLRPLTSRWHEPGVQTIYVKWRPASKVLPHSRLLDLLALVYHA